MADDTSFGDNLQAMWLATLKFLQVLWGGLLRNKLATILVFVLVLMVGSGQGWFGDDAEAMLIAAGQFFQDLLPNLGP